ncbi:MAG: hypothetical protein ACFFCS_12375, partial [Candidatus Hodarchaeota archaeon]
MEIDITKIQDNVKNFIKSENFNFFNVVGIPESKHRNHLVVCPCTNQVEIVKMADDEEPAKDKVSLFVFPNKDDCVNECKESGRFPAKNAQGVEELEGMMMRSLYKDMKK